MINYEITALLPYKDFDTIKFLKNNQDTVLFLGSKVAYSYNPEATHEDCPRVEKLQQGSQTFNNMGDMISLTYNISPSYEGHYGQYQIALNTEIFGPYGDEDVRQILNKDTMYVLGKSYIGIAKLSSNSDSIYYHLGILRIKYQNNIYEKVP